MWWIQPSQVRNEQVGQPIVTGTIARCQVVGDRQHDQPDGVLAVRRWLTADARNQHDRRYGNGHRRQPPRRPSACTNFRWDDGGFEMRLDGRHGCRDLRARGHRAPKPVASPRNGLDVLRCGRIVAQGIPQLSNRRVQSSLVLDDRIAPQGAAQLIAADHLIRRLKERDEQAERQVLYRDWPSIAADFAGPVIDLKRTKPSALESWHGRVRL
ncbi:MAG: hypothetical protein U0Q12_18190 [Vicinamibacterales bacterium]